MRRTPRQNAVATIRRVARERGAPPTVDQYRETEARPSYNQIVDVFGSWADALEAAGFDPSNVSPNATKEDCLEAIRELAGQLDRDPRIVDYERLADGPSISTIRYRCGSWAEAKMEAGVVEYESDRPTRDDLIEGAETELDRLLDVEDVEVT